MKERTDNVIINYPPGKRFSVESLYIIDHNSNAPFISSHFEKKMI